MRAAGSRFPPFPGRPGLGLVALLAACEGTSRLEAPAPARELQEPAEPVEDIPRGVIVGPLTVDLPAAMTALNRLIPSVIGDLEDPRPLSLGRDRRGSFSFEVRREPFQLQRIQGDTIEVAAVLHYRGRAWIGSGLGDLGGSCGVDKTPPRARAVLQVVPYLTEDWRLGIRSRVAQLAALTENPRDQCQVTFLGLNVTGKVMEAAREAFEKLSPRIQERVAAVDVKTPLSEIWADLQKPIRLGDSLWLLLQPDSIHLGPLHSTRSTVSAELGMTAAPRIVTGPRPAVEPRPLPPLHPFHDSFQQRGFSLPVEGSFQYTVTSAELTRELRGKSVRVAGGEFRLHELELYGIPGGRVAVGVKFEGTASGVVWFVGTPSYQASTGMITVPDLDFDASSAGLLVAGLAWINASGIRDFLRENAQVSAGELLSQLQNLAVEELNRPVAPGVRLHATIGAAEPAGLVVRPRDILVRARAMGTARLEIGPEVFQRGRGATPVSSRPWSSPATPSSPGRNGPG